MSNRRVPGVRRVAAAMLVALASAFIGVGAYTSVAVASARSSAAAPQLKDPDKTARKLIVEWLTALKDQDQAAIADNMAPNFQIERADGSGTDRKGYLANPSVVKDFTLKEPVIAKQSGNTLTARWALKVSANINGVDYQDAEAPRLTTYVWRDGRWKLISYANFNPVH
jgi:ketosteroid isomerase-like protein